MSKIIRGTVLAAAVGSAAVYGVGEAKALWNENQITEKLKYSFEESDRRIGNVLTQVSTVIRDYCTCSYNLLDHYRYLQPFCSIVFSKYGQI